MKHRDEIIRWANSEEGTGVWQKDELNDCWAILTLIPWHKHIIYIVDDQWAELRKYQADGKQLQYKTDIDTWKDSIFTLEDNNTLLGRWRIKPEEPVYEWQWIMKNKQGQLWMTDTYFSENEIKNKFNSEIIEKYEPSKRERK